MSRIRLTIGELKLKGLDAAGSRAVIEALQSELTRILSDPLTRAEWARSHRAPVLRLGRIPLEAGTAGGRKFGKGLAQSIGRGLKQP